MSVTDRGEIGLTFQVGAGVSCLFCGVGMVVGVGVCICLVVETTQQFGKRLKRIVAKCNREFDIAGLCHELPRRVEQLHSKAGRKLSN